jgi:hypothetical protein
LIWRSGCILHGCAMENQALDRSKPAPPRGRYYNYFHLTHSREEFLLSFGQLLPGDIEPHVDVRIVTPATWAQVLHQMLGDALTHYRQTYGAIPTPEGDDAG